MRRFLLLLFVLLLSFANAYGAAPTVVGSVATTATADGTSHSITLPATTATNGIIVFVASDGAPTIGIDTTASGVDWVLGTPESYTSIVTGVWVWKASSSGSDVLTITTSATERVTALAYEINGHGTTLQSAATNGTGANSDPPNLSLSPTGDYLVFAFRAGDATVAPTVQPTGYSTLDTQSGGSGANTVSSACYLAVTSASAEDPGAFTVASEQYAVFTVAIPASGGTPTPTATPSVINWLMVVS